MKNEVNTMKSKRLIAALTAVVCCTGNALMPVITYAGENRDEVYDDSLVLSEETAQVHQALREFLWDSETNTKRLNAYTALKQDKKTVEVVSPDPDVLEIVKAYVNEKGLNAELIEYRIEEAGELTDGGDTAASDEITVTAITLKGDTNCDGQVDLSDAVMIMQALANPNKYGINGTAENHLTEQGKLNGDMNGDGLTVGDAQAIQRMLLGLDIDDPDDYDMVFGYDDFNSGKPLPSATIIIKSKSSCAKGEKLKINAAMGDIVLNPQNYDTAGEYEYDVYASDGIEDHKLEDNALIINGVHGEYTKEYSKDDAKQFDIGNKFENLDSYHHEITEIDFSDYKAGSTGCITFSFYSKHINDLDSGVSTDGTKRFIYYYVGEKGTAIGDSIENAKKAYKVAFNDSPEEILNYNEKTVDWYHGGNELEENYWNIVYNNYSAVISDTDELKEYLEIVYRDEVISKYLEKYDDIYFKNNVLLINSIYQPFGSEKPIYVIDSVTCLDKAIDINIKTIENGGDDMISVCLAQVAIPKDEYNNKAVNWNIMEYRDTSDIVNVDIDNSEYLIGNEDVSSAASTTQKLVLNCNSFCANGETLKVDMAMGDMYTYFQAHNGYPNYDSAGNPEYAVFTTENLKKIDDERLIINGEKSEYTKSFSKEDMESLDITGKDGDYAAYYHESAEIDFSNYEAGSTGSITFRFGWKADGENPLNASSDFIGMHQTMYFYIGENGTGISNNGIEAAQKAYEDKSDNDIMFYDSIYVKWNGKEVMSNLYDVLRKPSDEVLPISFKLSMSPDYNFEYKGKKLSEYANANNSEEMNKLKDLLMYGNQLQYGETIYTTGMPDGTKRTKEWYEERIEYFGKELLSKYIVDGKFLDENLRADINELTKNNRTVYKEAENAYYSYISDEAIKQLDEQNIRYEYLTEPKRVVIYVTAEEFKSIKLDNTARYGLDISVAKGLTVDAIA